MNRRDAMKKAREITWRVCMLGQFPTGNAELKTMCDEMNGAGYVFLRESIAGFDGLTVRHGAEAWYFAAPRRRNPGKKQTCTQYALSDVAMYGNACDALAIGKYAEAQRIFDQLESADLKSKLAEGLEYLEAELGTAEIEAQMNAPMTDLDAVREIFGGLGLNIEQKRPGCCIFVSGNTKPHKEELKAFGFRWAPKKSAWYWKPQAA